MLCHLTERMLCHSTERTLGKAGIMGRKIVSCTDFPLATSSRKTELRNGVADLSPRQCSSQSVSPSENLIFFTAIASAGVLVRMSSHREKSSAQATSDKRGMSFNY
jgi:hypothetical protein